MPELFNLPDWISAGAAAFAVVVSIIGFLWGRVDHAEAKRDAKAGEEREKARLEYMNRMATAADQIAQAGALSAQAAPAAAQLRNVVRWRLRRVDQATNRIVYALTNTGNDVAYGVTASAPDYYQFGKLLAKLPQDATITAHQDFRFYLEVRLGVVPLPELRVVWDGGDETVPVSG